MTPFMQAKPGDESFVYSLPDGELLYDGVQWVTTLDHFNHLDRDGPLTLRRQVWRLVSENTIELDDPYPADDGEDDT